MDKLKDLIRDKRQEKKNVFAGNKFVKRSQVEADRLKRLREEEEEDNRLRGKKSQKVGGDDGQNGTDNQASGTKCALDKGGQNSKQDLPKEEVIRRLRALGQPATLFGEDDLRRLKRLYRAEEELEMEGATSE
eukprot:TRINITY_DN13061_c0_g1_i4.p2 TRINITY_DN13061_c0_g1~~TRINITY_DN13061_c0_g1_i4.p2  ORF type:complete len:142 (-),score=33.93 TRINITY_DN13061_c0_g1_i4:54-452(-)